VQIGLGPDGAQVSLPASTSPAPSGPVAPGDAGAPPARALTPNRDATPASRAHAGLVPASNAAHAATVAPRTSTRAPRPSAIAVEPQPGAVNASLRHQSPGGVWSLLHDLASAPGLWIALLFIVAIARFAAGGLLHDAFRRRARLSA